MTPAEAAALLAVAAAFDNRKPDPDAATAWALALEGRSFNDCRDAVVQHYRVSREWIMPSDVLAGVKAMRSARLSEFWRKQGRSYLLPPPHLADDPAAENRWTNEMVERICNGEIVEPDELDYRDPELVHRDVIGDLGQIGREVPPA